MYYAGQPIDPNDPYAQNVNSVIAQKYPQPQPQAGGMLMPGMVPNPAGQNPSAVNPNMSAVAQQAQAQQPPNFQQIGQPGQEKVGGAQPTTNSQLFSNPQNATQAIANGLRDPNVQANLKKIGYGIGDVAGSAYDSLAGLFS